MADELNVSMSLGRFGQVFILRDRPKILKLQQIHLPTPLSYHILPHSRQAGKEKRAGRTNALRLPVSSVTPAAAWG